MDTIQSQAEEPEGELRLADLVDLASTIYPLDNS